MEEAQILENKQTGLQKLIDMFAHQSNVFLLNHKSTEDIPMPSLGDYSEYDHVNDIDESRTPVYLGDVQSDQLDTPNIKDGLETNAEDMNYPAPIISQVGMVQWKGLQALAEKEAKLHYAQATDSVHRIHLALGFKAALFQTEVQHSWTQKTKTQVWAAVYSVDLDASVHKHAWNYSMARDAYCNVIDPSGQSPKLQQLELAELHVETFAIGPGQVGQRNKQLSWIWSFETSTKQDGTWIDNCECSLVLEIWINTQQWNSQQGPLCHDHMQLWSGCFFFLPIFPYPYHPSSLPYCMITYLVVPLFSFHLPLCTLITALLCTAWPIVAQHKAQQTRSKLTLLKVLSVV